MSRSVLQLTVGGTPFPHGDPDGTWRYRHAVRPDGPTEVDHQIVADFFAYEMAHGRSVTVQAPPELADWATWAPSTTRPSPGQVPIQCCTHAFPQGCAAAFVCHGTTTQAAASILRVGEIWPSTRVTGRPGDGLSATSTWGEPADYFEHVMFAHGHCTAPEAVATSRRLGRDLVPDDLETGYTPAVRFYLPWADLAAHPNARFDGVHPIKTLGSLSLADVSVAVVVHADQADGVLAVAPSWARIIVLNIPSPTPDAWARAALQAVRSAL